MNDRYLFKAKQIDWKQLPEGKWWVRGYYVKTDGIPYIFSRQENEIAQRIYSIDGSTICQCTGLKDKSGTLIWENDIIRCGRPTFVSWNEKICQLVLNKKRLVISSLFRRIARTRGLRSNRQCF